MASQPVGMGGSPQWGMPKASNVDYKTLPKEQILQKAEELKTRSSEQDTCKFIRDLFDSAESMAINQHVKASDNSAEGIQYRTLLNTSLAMLKTLSTDARLDTLFTLTQTRGPSNIMQDFQACINAETLAQSVVQQK